jgi:hypothetical protein
MVEQKDENQTTAHHDVSAPAEAITNFQIIPDNGGFLLLLGKRRVKGDTFGRSPELITEISSVNFLSHSMAADLSRVLGVVVRDFESLWGHIPIPGIDTPQRGIPDAGRSDD